MGIWFDQCHNVSDECQNFDKESALVIIVHTISMAHGNSEIIESNYCILQSHGDILNSSPHEQFNLLLRRTLQD